MSVMPGPLRYEAIGDREDEELSTSDDDFAGVISTSRVSRKHLFALPILATALVGLASFVFPEAIPPAVSHSFQRLLHTSVLASDTHADLDYYAQPGFLQIDRREEVPIHRRARWLHLDVLDSLTQENKTGLEGGEYQNYGDGWNLLDEYITTLTGQNTTSSYQDELYADPGSDRLGYLKDKTIVSIGDSVDRGAIDHACSLLNGKLTYRQFKHPPYDLLTLESAGAQLAAAHHCQLPKVLGNTTIWSFMTYSSMGKDQLFRVALNGTQPRELDQRLPLIAMALERVGVSPDLMIFHTLMWDLNAANLLDAIADLPPSDVLTLEYLSEFRRKLHSSLDQLDTLFPKTKKLYRLLHQVRVDEGDWFMNQTPPGTRNISRTPYANNKGEQLNAIVREVAPQHDHALFDFGSVQAGYTGDFLDAIHPGEIGNTLYTQMLLYYLKKLT